MLSIDFFFVLVVSFVVVALNAEELGQSEDSLSDSLNDLSAELSERSAESAQLKSESADADTSLMKGEKLDDYYSPLRFRSAHFEEDATFAGEKAEGRMNGITAQQQKDILDLHNALRRKEGSSNMYKLHWNEKLAVLGQQWSQRCVFEHGQPPHDAAGVGYKDIGQNIFAHTTPAFNVKMAVQAWYDEKADYNYNGLSCRPGKVCGHYTAVTWGDTKEVGCGMTFCPSISGLSKAHYIVCNYGPPGNWAGEKPFLKGAACSKCGGGKFFCDNDLCDHKCRSEGPHCKCRVACKNNAQTKDCSCTCKEGYMGVDCADPCKDLSNLCGANPGYPAPFCKMTDPNWAFIKDKCPKMCGKCKSKRGNAEYSSDDLEAKKLDSSSLVRLLGRLLAENQEEKSSADDNNQD